MAVLLMLASTQAYGAGGVKVEHLGVNNTLVRIAGDGRYVLLPVQESLDDATVNVLVDGKLDRTIRVRLAKSKVDYSVPFDLTPYKGHDVVLNIVSNHDRTNVREAKDDACWSAITLSDTFDTTNTEKYRPIYHHTPVYGWMNDPNGMFYKDGVWHLYYQWNPYGSKWQNLSWGHSTSTDLVNWEDKGVAIEPDGLGLIFSGSCAVDRNGTAGYGKDAVVAMYTSADASQVQSLAGSRDNGATFEKYAGNPVLPLDSEARDPNMFYDESTGLWHLTLAHALEHEMLFFTSPDLKTWTATGSFGKGLGAQGGVWECPDLFRLPVDGGKEYKWVLLCNLNPGGPFGGSGIQYFTGDFDGKTFKADTDADGTVPTKWLDYGKDNYAVVSWSDAPDGRRTLIGWMSNWQYAPEVPTKQYRSANTLPREISLFTGDDGRVYAATVPSPETDSMRGKASVRKSFRIGKKPVSVALPTVNDGVCEITIDIDAQRSEKVEMTLGNSAGDKVVMTYDPKAATFGFDRTHSGLTDFSVDFPAVTTAPTFTADGKMSLRIFIDRSSVEVFGNGGRFAMTNLVFPTSPYNTFSIKADGGKAKVGDLTVYPISTK